MLVDTSAWVEFLRGTGSPVAAALRSAIEEERDLGVPDVVRLELLAGAAESAVDDLQRLLARFEAVPTMSPADHDLAARLYRLARRDGRTVRSLVDCLVAAIALRLDLAVLARDRDYEVLADVAGLRVV
jgi:predicted nucleic acid-binding protein